MIHAKHFGVVMGECNAQAPIPAKKLAIPLVIGFAGDNMETARSTEVWLHSIAEAVQSHDVPTWAAETNTKHTTKQIGQLDDITSFAGHDVTFRVPAVFGLIIVCMGSATNTTPLTDLLSHNGQLSP